MSKDAAREEAVRLLTDAGVSLNWPEEYALPVSRVEITRRLLGLCRESGADFASWHTPLTSALDDGEGEDVGVLMEVEDAFGMTLSESDWAEANAQTFGDMVLFMEERLRRRWHSRLANVPGGCESQAVFYAVRRALGDGGSRRTRPSDPLPPATASTLDALNDAVKQQYGVALPEEYRLFGRLPVWQMWFALWLTLSIVLVLSFSCGEMWAASIILAYVLLYPVFGLARPVWPRQFHTLGDVACYVVAEHAKNQERMRLALRTAGTAPSS